MIAALTPFSSLFLSLSLCAPAVAPSPATAPATQPSSDGPASVVEVAGLAQVRPEASQPWRRAEVGQLLRPGAAVRLGPKSVVRLKTADGAEVTLERLGTYTVSADLPAQAAADGGRNARTRVTVGADPYVRSPNSVLSVRSGPVEFEEDTGRWVLLPRPQRPVGPATAPSTKPTTRPATDPEN